MKKMRERVTVVGHFLRPPVLVLQRAAPGSSITYPARTETDRVRWTSPVGLGLGFRQRSDKDPTTFRSNDFYPARSDEFGEYLTTNRRFRWFSQCGFRKARFW
ncbi:hypothetical protein HanIR_Chr02g0061611 [Helianthus annuus]|nr:hypothetical protein HanIR_Chr02g0061611 [Helianthus annuus]